jgi:hypothetical protein
MNDDLVRQIMRDMIAYNGTVQHISHSYILGGKKGASSDMEAIKSSADQTRKKIRELAQAIRVEY